MANRLREFISESRPMPAHENMFSWHDESCYWSGGEDSESHKTPEISIHDIETSDESVLKIHIREVKRQMADRVREAMSFATLRTAIADLSRQVEDVRRGSGSIIVMVHSFAPEPYEAIKPFGVTVQPIDGEFLATFFDANVSAMGDTEVESVENLKSRILDHFDLLASKPTGKLGKAMARQLAVLREFVRKQG